MSISRMHFEAIAEVIADDYERFKSPKQHAAFAADMAIVLRNFNPYFDRARFIAACTPRHYVGTRLANAFDREESRVLTEERL